MAPAMEHLAKAKTAIQKSDVSLMEAATEIRKALEIDASLTMTRVGEMLGRSGDWVSALLRWAENHDDGEAMYSADSSARLRRAVKQGFRDLPGETILALMQEAGVHFRHLLEPDRYDRDGKWIGVVHPPVEGTDHFRRYQLSRLDAWGLKYRWVRLSEQERVELAPEMAAALRELVATIEELLEGVHTPA